LVAERGEPGEYVTELVKLFFTGAFTSGLGELTEFLAEPGDGRRDPAGAVVLAIEPFHQALNFVQCHREFLGIGNGRI